MSAFRFTKPALPRRMVLFAGYGLVAVVTLIGLTLLSGASARNGRIAEMEAVIARAEATAQSGDAGTGLDASAFYTGDTPQLAQALLQTNPPSSFFYYEFLVYWDIWSRLRFWRLCHCQSCPLF